MSAADPSLGSCCMCRSHRHVRTIVMLPVKAVVRGHGWGCVICRLPCDGAYAVLCDDCIPLYRDSRDVLRFACLGWAGTEGRVPIAELTEPHEHDLSVEH